MCFLLQSNATTVLLETEQEEIFVIQCPVCWFIDDVKNFGVQAAWYQISTGPCDLTDEQCCHTKEIQNKVESKAVADWD